MGARWPLPAFALCTALLGSACSERSDTTPTAPGEIPSLVTSALSCSFPTITAQVKDEFLNTTQKNSASGLVQNMKNAGQYTAGAKTAGFGVMALIATAKKQNTAKDAATGSSLTNQLILCMFDPTSGADNFPSPFPVDFVPSLDRNQPGAYEVRSPTNDANAVLTFPGPTGTEFARISALTPMSGNWSGLLGETTLIFGKPVLLGSGPARDPDQYEWKTIRPGVTFATSTGGPGLLVALCNLSSSLTDTDLESETEVGFLPYVGTLPGCSAAFTQLETSWRALDLVRAVGRYGSRLLSPEPLSAATLVAAASIGGGAKGGKSIFSRNTLNSSTAISLKFVTQPSDGKLGTPILPAVQVQATYQGTPVGGVIITLTGINNNGTPTEVDCPGPAPAPATCSALTGLDGIATFNPLTVTKTGAQTLVVNGASITDRPAISFGTGTLSKKVNIRPAH